VKNIEVWDKKEIKTMREEYAYQKYYLRQYKNYNNDNSVAVVKK
jgi:hypothetical protein